MDTKRDDRPGDAVQEDGRADSGKIFRPEKARGKDSPPIPRGKSKSRPIGRPLAATDYEELKKGAASDSSAMERNSAQQDPSVKKSSE